MEKVYKSKLGNELTIPIGIIMIGVTLFMLMSASWLGLLIMAGPILFIIHLFLNTSYTIKGNALRIKCGFLYRAEIDINSIRKIRETNNAISSPATSLERLEISYNKIDSILISPQEKQDFIRALALINSSIEIEYKK